METLNSDLVIQMIDEALVGFGSQSLLDANKVRDILLDIRSVLSSYIMEHVPEIAEEAV